jgi:hypothetical protein
MIRNCSIGSRSSEFDESYLTCWWHVSAFGLRHKTPLESHSPKSGGSDGTRNRGLLGVTAIENKGARMACCSPNTPSETPIEPRNAALVASASTWQKPQHSLRAGTPDSSMSAWVYRRRRWITSSGSGIHFAFRRSVARRVARQKCFATDIPMRQ